MTTYAAGWKKFEPLWDAVIRAKRAGIMLPALEVILSEFGKRAPRPGDGAHRQAPADARLPDGLDLSQIVEPVSWKATPDADVRTAKSGEWTHSVV